MAIATKSTFSKQIPEEYTSYVNIEASFPPVFEDGKRLLWELAGKIQIMRLETELFPQLTVESNKEVIKSKEKEYIDIQKQVADFRATLQSINGQIQRAISLCDAVPNSDIRSFELNRATTKVYDFCRKSLPTLNDWSLQGTLLDKRFDLVMTRDYKHYTESIGNYQATINPAYTFLSSLTSTIGNLFSSRIEAVAETPSSHIKLEAKAQNICFALLSIDNALLETLSLQPSIKAFISIMTPDESSKYEDYKPQLIFLKVLLSKINRQEAFRGVTTAGVEAALSELQKQISLALARRLYEKTPLNLTPYLEQLDFSQAIVKIDPMLQGTKATSAALKTSLQHLAATQLESYRKPAKDPYKIDLLNQLVILASKLN